MRFEFATANRILFGPGAVREVPALAASLGRRALVVTGRSGERGLRLLAGLRELQLEAELFHVTAEPTTAMVQTGVQSARALACDLVIGVGGGSALDAGKAIAALLPNPGEVLDYLEVIGRGRPLEKAPAAYIAVPTTAGTGSEVTRNAVLASPEHRLKVSLRSAQMLPRVAVVDPELTHSAPVTVTAAAGLDALTQLIEPFVGNAANPLTDAVCREGLRRAARSLRRVFQDGQDAAAREDMALASLMGGLALANARLGAVHGFAGPIGGLFPAPHGAICARLLPFVMEANLRALGRSSVRPAQALGRYAEVAQLLTNNPNASAADGVAWVRETCDLLETLPLGHFGLTHSDIPDIVAQAKQANSMKGNPVTLLDEELAEVLQAAL
jgi:alcohol dehydrogenase class IV